MRVRLHNPESDILGAVGRLALLSPDGSVEWREIAGTRPHKSFMLTRFAGIDDANRAEELIGRAVAVQRDELPEPARARSIISTCSTARCEPTRATISGASST